MNEVDPRTGKSLFILRFPIITYVTLTILITWSVWFSIPVFTGKDWTLTKIFLGAGMGPGLAAIILDRIRGTAGKVDRLWWNYFTVIVLAVLLLNISSLVYGDSLKMEEFENAIPPGISFTGIFGALLSAIVCGLIFAYAARSRSRELSSIVNTKAPLTWWLIALLLPAATALAGMGLSMLFDLELPPAPYADLPLDSWAFYVSRAILFTFLVVSIGEETGWRGWMQPWMQRRYSPLVTSLIIGVVWGLWHFPLHAMGFYGGNGEDVLNQLFISPWLAILFTWIYNRSGGNLLLALVFHTSINNTGRILPQGDLSFLLLFLITMAVIFTDKMWRRPRTVDELQVSEFRREPVAT